MHGLIEIILLDGVTTCDGFSLTMLRRAMVVLRG
jgi:hypothetical protein